MVSEDSEDYGRFLVERREAILERISEAAVRAGRNPEDVLLLAVSKTVGPDEVALAWRAGYRAFGENRPQELTRKLTALAAVPEMAGARFDMIGNLQKNKINQVVGCVTLIHSISSAHLAEAVSKRSVTHCVTSDVLLEINVSGEETKSGFSPAEVSEALDGIVALPGIRLCGLMSMAPAHDADEARRTFSGLRSLAEDLRVRTGLPLEELSCGMSDDYPIAVEEGSTIVRLGRTVFDPNYVIQ
jgi:pyridoxal phosphate enzyme (YggS family)